MSHPYLPEDLEFPGLTPIATSSETLLSTFFLAWAIICSALFFLLRSAKRITKNDGLICCWLACSGLTHLLVEGSVVFNSTFFADPPGSFMSDLCEALICLLDESSMNKPGKEYGKADSRYLTRDACTMGIETITVVLEGPVCLILIWAFMRGCAWRQAVTVVVSIGQIYGTILYFMTSYFEGFEYQRKEAMYFWLYFVGMNGIWIVVPSLVVLKMMSEINSAVLSFETK